MRPWVAHTMLGLANTCREGIHLSVSFPGASGVHDINTDVAEMLPLRLLHLATRSRSPWWSEASRLSFLTAAHYSKASNIC